MGHLTGRLKTGTPPRISRKSLNFDLLNIAPGSAGNISFSYPNKELMPIDKQVDCYTTYTNSATHTLILDNIKESPVFSGFIKEKAPRSCPSLDSKVMNFSGRERHPIFLEPMVNPCVHLQIN
jgi:tRNA uridine 5-carboxymethylaminomethyl modification enzyme